VCQLCVSEGRGTNARGDRCVDDCTAVNDDDADLGRVVTPANVDVSDLPSARIVEAELEHLDAPKSRELLQLGDEFAGRFSDEAGLCDAAVHRVRGRRISSRGRCHCTACQISPSRRSIDRILSYY